MAEAAAWSRAACAHSLASRRVSTWLGSDFRAFNSVTFSKVPAYDGQRPVNIFTVLCLCCHMLLHEMELDVSPFLSFQEAKKACAAAVYVLDAYTYEPFLYVFMIWTVNFCFISLECVISIGALMGSSALSRDTRGDT